MKKILSLFMLSLLFTTCFCQELEKVAHCPSNEIYDMMIDHKGFLWIAHSLGISRYDGISFKSFSNADQSAVSASGLLEDDYGRIWFNNFNGQVFYIQNEKMIQLKEYDFKSSFNFPHMVIFGKDLVISCKTGLFICNTANLQCEYKTGSGKDPFIWGPYSLGILNNKILARSNDFWYTYNKEEGFRKLPFSEVPIENKSPMSNIQPKSLINMCFVVDSSGHSLYGLSSANNKISLTTKVGSHGFINTISIIGNNVWANTFSESSAVFSKDSLSGYNLSSIVVDKNGNTWYGSLSSGLWVSYKSNDWEKKYADKNQNDYIKCMINNKGHFIYITQEGEILEYSQRNKTFKKIAYIQGEEGKTENIQKADDSDYFIETSKSLYILNTITKKIRLAVSHQSIKSIALVNDKIFVGVSTGVMIKNYNYIGLAHKNTDTFKIKKEFLYASPGDRIFLSTILRCRAVLYDSSQKTVFVAFTDGLHKINNGMVSGVLYRNTPLYVSSLTEWNNKIYAGTFNNGLFVITPDSVIKINNDSESPLDAIVKMKCCNNHLWLFRTRDIQVLDERTDKFVDIPPLPADVADVTDVEEDSTTIYMATYHGLFTTPVNTDINITKTDISLLYLLINNRDTVYTGNPTLANNKNNLIFKLAIPVYNNADRLHFKYSLINGGGDTTWYYTQDAQRDIQFNALKPGSYTFEAIAVKDDEVVSNAPLIYSFSIDQPWFNTWWFYTCILLAVVSAALALQQYRLRQILKIERIRRKISNDLHDDIGSTLSSINVYSELAKREDDNKEYVSTIQQNTVAIISNLDDLVWNINPKNDVLENLVNRMRLFAEPLLTENNNIECAFTIEVENMHTAITPDLRTNIYLLFKEMINNIIKHARCTICNIAITQKGKLFALTVKDNGRGFNTDMINRHRNGLHNMQQRTKDIKGNITINSLPGAGTEITITCTLK